jgi:hypothetical protein
MHEQLCHLLPEPVYNALDATAGLSASERAKVLSACKKNELGALLDNTTSAAFGHQFSLALHEGAHFDAVKRGLALAAAGRSAAATSGTLSATFDLVTRDSLFLQLKTQWTAIEPSLRLPTELSGTFVNTLWAGVTLVFQIRAGRAESWGVPEVLEACLQQLAALPAYRTAIASAVARASESPSSSAGPHPINVAYANFFVPTWWEHILGRAQLTEATLASTVKIILDPLPCAAPRPAPQPPYAGSVAPPQQAYPFYHAPPNYAHFPPPGTSLGPTPPAPTSWGPSTAAAPPPAKAPRGSGGGNPPYLGKPVSALIVGNSLGLAVIAHGRLCSCSISAAFPGRSHRPFECPLKYHSLKGQCPGWTPAGARIPSCWVGDDLTPACRADWASFAATLTTSLAASGVDVAF